MIYLRLLIFDNNRRISRYSQIKVTIRPKAAYHSMYLGTPARAPFSMKSKSSTKFSAAMMTINTLTPIPRRARSIDCGKVNSEEPQHKLHQIKECNAAGGRDHSQLEFFGGANYAGAVGEQQNYQSAKGQPDGLYGDSVKARFIHRRDAAQHQAFQQRIQRRGNRRPLLLENGDQGNDEAADATDHQRQDGGFRSGGKSVPAPGCSEHGANQENPSLIYRA